MIEKVMDYVQEQHMLEEGDCVVAGVSGGADSVCLLFMLLEIRKKIPIEITVVHVNHLVRREAAQDAAYVKSLCDGMGLAFILVESDVEALARARRISTEEAGRSVRYEAFEKALGGREGKIAVAHNKNDCCETFLFHLFRGSSLKGLSGIRPVRGKVIRPLLCLERAEIETFLQERNISFCIDSTNLEDNYTRNKIRHHILGAAVRDVSPAAVDHIFHACGRVKEAYDLIGELADEGFAACVAAAGRTYHIEEKSFAALHKAIQNYVVLETLSRAAGSSRDLEAVHAGLVCGLMGKQCGRRLDLPYGLRAERDYSGVTIYKEQGSKEEEPGMTVLSKQQEAALFAGDELEIPLAGNSKLFIKIIKKSDFDMDLKNIPEKKYTKWLDYDKIKDSIVIRTRMPGDYLTVNSTNRHKTLKAYFIDNKVPRRARGKICLVTEKSHVLWVVGGRISSFYKVSEGTKTILRLTFNGESVMDNS